MKFNRIHTLLSVLLTISLTSCEKFLDKKSNTGIDVPNQLSDLQALLDDALIMNQGVTPSFGEAYADDYFMLQSVFDARTEAEKSIYQWIPFDYFWDNDWAKCYTPVYNANYCLEMLANIAITASNKLSHDNIKGSALFYRSYYFMQLAWNFAKAYDESSSSSDLGIVLRLGSDFNVPSVRANVKETYDRIIMDAKESVEYLPNLPQHVFRPSKSAAYGLLARTYLSMRKYDSALKYASLCLNIKNDLLDFGPDINENSNSPFAPPFNREIIFYTEMNRTAGIVHPLRGLIDTVLYVSYAGNDLRKKAYFRPNTGYYRFKGSYTGGTILFSGIATDEIFFIKAECHARIGNKDDALNDLNAVLVKRHDATFVPITASDASEALNIILNERRKELYWRGLRFADIKRLNKEGYNITPTRLISGQTLHLPSNDNKYAIPLPKDIIDQSGIPQNPQ